LSAILIQYGNFSRKNDLLKSDKLPAKTFARTAEDYIKNYFQVLNKATITRKERRV
jgi:hypothetical protein